MKLKLRKFYQAGLGITILSMTGCLMSKTDKTPDTTKVSSSQVENDIIDRDPNALLELKANNGNIIRFYDRGTFMVATEIGENGKEHYIDPQNSKSQSLSELYSELHPGEAVPRELLLAENTITELDEEQLEDIPESEENMFEKDDTDLPQKDGALGKAGVTTSETTFKNNYCNNSKMVEYTGSGHNFRTLKCGWHRTKVGSGDSWQTAEETKEMYGRVEVYRGTLKFSVSERRSLSGSSFKESVSPTTVSSGNSASKRVYVKHGVKYRYDFRYFLKNHENDGFNWAVQQETFNNKRYCHEQKRYYCLWAPLTQPVTFKECRSTLDEARRVVAAQKDQWGDQHGCWESRSWVE